MKRTNRHSHATSWSTMTFLVIVMLLMTLLPHRLPEVVATEPVMTPEEQPPGEPQPQASHTVYLPLITTPMTSEQLIEAALERGEIDAETALIYRVFADFGDPRLPDAYQGVNEDTFDTLILREVAEQFDELSESAQAILQPYFIPPAYEGSWYDAYASEASQATHTTPDTAPAQHSPKIKGNWKSLTGTRYVRIWWDMGDPTSLNAASMLASEADDIWLILKALLQVTPPQDKIMSSKTLAYWGGDGRLDIYVMGRSSGYDGLTAYHNPGCTAPPYIIINSSSQVPFKAILAHEMMHAFQAGFQVGSSCKEYDWWSEATAVWAEDYVYPTLSDRYPAQLTEHGYAEQYLHNETRTSLNDLTYEAYLFPFFLTGPNHSRADLIRKIWQNARHGSSLDAIETTLQAEGLGGFEEQWPKFALYNWNRNPITHYRTWDNITFAPDPNKLIGLPVRADGDGNYTPVTLGSKTQDFYPIMFELPHLTADYVRFKFTDDNVRTIGWKHTDPDSSGYLDDIYFAYGNPRVQALIKVNGTWQPPEEWIGNKYMCRDKPDEHIEELVLIVSNSDDGQSNVPDPLVGQADLYFSKIPCAGEWHGSASCMETLRDEFSDYSKQATTQRLVFTQPERRQYQDEYIVRWVTDADLPPPCQWKVSGTEYYGTCSINDSGKGFNTAHNINYLEIVSLDMFAISGRNRTGEYHGISTCSNLDGSDIKWLVRCDDPPPPREFEYSGTFLTFRIGTGFPKATGPTLIGISEDMHVNTYYSCQWNLTWRPGP